MDACSTLQERKVRDAKERVSLLWESFHDVRVMNVNTSASNELYPAPGPDRSFYRGIISACLTWNSFSGYSLLESEVFFLSLNIFGAVSHLSICELYYLYYERVIEFSSTKQCRRIVWIKVRNKYLIYRNVLLRIHDKNATLDGLIFRSRRENSLNSKTTGYYDTGFSIARNTKGKFFT